MRRVGAILSLITLAITIASCGAGTEHTWRAEFTARLEGAAGSVEEARQVIHPHMHEFEYLAIFPQLSQTLESKSALIQELDPPEGCEEVQEMGERAIRRLADLSHALPQNLTPRLADGLPTLIEEKIADLEAIEGEAEACASG